MLARFIIKNLFSFKEQTEFNLFPGKASRLRHHKYERKEIELLKLSALYGANGSGKSNLIKSIALLKQLVLEGRIPNLLNQQKFKLAKECASEPVELGIEFFCNVSYYYYSVAIHENVIVEEYFGESGIGKDEDTMIFHRKTTNNINSVEFFHEFTENSENSVLAKVITQDLLKPQQPLFSLLRTLSNDAFNEIRYAYEWFNEGLQIIFPQTSAHHLAHELDTNAGFNQFANALMCTFHTGISQLKVEVKPIEDLLGKDNQKQLDEILSDMQNNPDEKLVSLTNRTTGEEISVVKDKEKVLAKRLYFEHSDRNGNPIAFDYSEESDGTRRLLEYIPAFSFLIGKDLTIIIDEIERSIHPLIIKEILAKFSGDNDTKGQLIFTTHESNLLDQDIFRTDEIWFAEKDGGGSTKLYPLSDFKEHSTIDIQKGYLNGRYGAVPFVGNLHDLNWNKYADVK